MEDQDQRSTEAGELVPSSRLERRGMEREKERDAAAIRSLYNCSTVCLLALKNKAVQPQSTSLISLLRIFRLSIYTSQLLP